MGKYIPLIGDVVDGAKLTSTLGALRGGAKYSYSAPPLWLLRIFVYEFYVMIKAFNAVR